MSCTADTDCSGHGQCVNSTCTCDPEFIGAKCEACLDQNADYVKDCACKAGYIFLRGECVASACLDSENVICGSQGHCIEGKCECDAVATGALCTQCTDVAAQTPQGCLLKCSGMCRLQGYECTSGIVPGQGVCACAKENFDPKQACKHCVNGYKMIDGECISHNCVSDDVVCGHHGLCVNNDCQCYKEYDQHHCNDCKADAIKLYGYCLQKCTDDNNCMNRGFQCVNVGKESVCECKDQHGDPDHGCMGCKKGYTQTITHGCQLEQCVINNKLCNNNGKCQDGACVCKDSNIYSGEFCEKCTDDKIQTIEGHCVATACLDRISQQECGGNGDCVLDTGNYACVCKTGYEGHMCSKCAATHIQYHEKCFNKTCFSTGSEEPCNLNGICNEQGRCLCDGAAFGRYCEGCKPAFQMMNDGECIARTCITNNQECNGQGWCVRGVDEFAEDKCLCNMGYTPESNCVDCKSGYVSVAGECASTQCIGRMSPLPCSGKGTCQEIDFVNGIIGCFCNEGFTGRFCDSCDEDSGFIHTHDNTCANRACVGRDGYECSGNGKCVNGFESIWECNCNGGSNGKFCTDCNEGFKKLATGHCIFETCVSNNKECNGHGTCRQLGFNHQCICKNGYANKDNCTKCIDGFSYHAGTDTCVQGAETNKANVGMIVGIVIGVLLFLVAIGLVVFFILKKKGGPKTTKSKNNVPKDMQSAQKFSI